MGIGLASGSSSSVVGSHSLSQALYVALLRLTAVPENKYCVSLHYMLVKGRSERLNDLPKAIWWLLAGREDTMFLTPSSQGQMRGAVLSWCKGGKQQ